VHKNILASCLAAALLLPCAAPARAAAEFIPDQVAVANLPPADRYRLYVSDFAIPHVVDGRLHIIDGASATILGTVASGFGGISTLSPDRKELYVATTYYTRLNRGERVDQVDVYDAATLALKHEIAIPPKHAQMLNYRGGIRTSSDGRLLFVQNATPATSISVIDTVTRTFLAEIATPGCWIVLPAQSVPNRFSTLCGDGSLLTVTLDAMGKPLSQLRSKPLFDPATDPLFVHAENIGDRYFFISYKGVVHVANLGGAEALVEDAWPLMDAADLRQGWRPGGYQPFGLHEQSGRLYVGVHARGKEGSHKDPAQQIWVIDIAGKRRLARLPGQDAIAVSASRGEAPKLFAISGKDMSLAIFDDADGKPVLKRRLPQVGETATLVETQ
jgi:methylamine dehydrogenase heavy chain